MSDPVLLYCVGATKAGTSWLYSYLRTHPEAHVRAVKELHYFRDFDVEDDGWFARQCDQRLVRVAEEHAAASDPARKARLEVELRDCADLAELHHGEKPDLSAYRAYLEKGRGDEGVVADLTPAYGLLPVSVYQMMRKVAPTTRFIYIMRDPVARLWSHIRMSAGRKCREETEIPARADRIFARFARGRQMQIWERSDYKSTLERLNAALAPGQLLVLFYEELFNNSAIRLICEFLGIRAHEARFDQRVNASPVLAMSDEQRLQAQHLLADQYAYVAQQTDHLPDAWRVNMIEVPA